jgi:glycosyltransferase involved in cell wall biosynthesis
VTSLNVLQIYYEPTPAGQTRHVSALVQALASQSHHVAVVMPDGLWANQGHPGVKAAWVDSDQKNIQTIPLPMRKLLWPWVSLLALGRLLCQERWDIVHVHSLEAGLCGRLTAWVTTAPKRHSPRIVYTPQTIDIRQTRWHRLYTWVERLLSAVTDAIISVNEADRQRLIGWGISSFKVINIPNGIDLPAYHGLMDTHSAREYLGLHPDRPVVMQVARLSAQKNPLAFLEGAALVTQQHPDVQFAMVGQGPLKDTVSSHIRALGLQDQVHLLGWRDNACRLMTAANVVTLTSRWEGAPYSVLEAMAASRPVVATAVNGCPEVIADGQTGFLTPPGDARTWAARVIQLLESPQLAKAMGQRARARVEQSFSVQATTTRTIELYRQLVGNNTTKGTT